MITTSAYMEIIDKIKDSGWQKGLGWRLTRVGGFTVGKDKHT
jgi:hypothetical protein